MNIKRKLFSMLLLILGAVVQLSAQSAVNVGSQVTSEDGITSGKAYILKTGAERYITDNGTNYDVPNAVNSATEASVYYLISNGDGTWKIKNLYTGKYWGVPVYNAALTSVAEASAGTWSLNFSENIAYPSAPDASSTVRGIDRSGGKVWGWTTGNNNNHKVYIYEVAPSTTALSELADKDIDVASDAAASLSEGQWYIMSQRSRTSYVFENTSDHKLKHTLTKPSGSATNNAGYLVRLINAGDGKYYLQNGYGNYMGAIAASTNVPTTALSEEAVTVEKIAGTDGHFYLQGTTNGVILDANDFTKGDPSTVVGWGTTAPTSTGNNNDWAFYPVTFKSNISSSDVYTINNTNDSRGAMMYAPTQSTQYVWSSGKNSQTFDPTSTNCQWVLYPTGTEGQYYLYNVGSGKFAIPSSTASTASWIFSSSAVAVTLILQSDGTYKIKTATTDTYAAVSNGFNGPIINYNDVGGNFTITKVDGDQSEAASAAVAKLVDNVTPLSAIPADGTSDWYIIRIKTHGTYADRYVYPAENEIVYSSTNYPLTFDHGANVRPAIDEAIYYTRIIREGNTVYWQMPNGKYLYGANNKFPVSTFDKSTFSMDYTSGSGIRMWGGSRYAVPYYLGNKYFIGETSSTGNAYYDLYPIDLDEAGLTAWQVVIGLGTNVKATCTHSDVCGIKSVYNNGFIFLPTGVIPTDTDFSVDVPGVSTITVINSTNHVISIMQAPDFFCENYGEKWVRIKSSKNSNLVVTLNSLSSGADASMKPHDFCEAKQLWSFVGDANSFVIYNKAAGEDYLLVSEAANPGQAATITLQPSASASNTTWKLGTAQLSSSDAPGYTLYSTGGDGSYSMHGWQNGVNVKYWGAASGGSHYTIEDASGEITLALEGLDPGTMTVFTQNIANLPLTLADADSKTLLTKDNFTNITAYVPNNSQVTFGTPAMFQNYGFIGYDGTDQSKVVTATTTPQTVTATFSVVRPDARYLWEPLRIYSGSGEKDYYRIPAIVTAKDGDIIAINDRRFSNGSDIGNNHHIDIIGVASSDNGATWGEEFMIMDGNNGGEKAYGDAAVVADRESNQILVMACGGNISYQSETSSNHQSIDRVVLTKNGDTWTASSITNVTDQFYAGTLASSNGMFIGSGSISQSRIIKKGDYYRVYCAVLAKEGNFAFYSDDFGSTWTMMGTTSAANDNEAKIEELPNGSVLLSVRKSYGRTFNLWTWDDDTYTSGSWGTAVATNNQTGGISFGGNSTNGDIRVVSAIKKSTGEVVSLAMQSVPTGSGRSNVSLFYKELDPNETYTSTTIAQNWSSAYQVTPHASAYSSFNMQADGRIGFFMEEAPISLSEAGVGYYLCYVPLTLDEITNNQYTGLAATYPVTLNVVGDKSYATLYLPYDVTTSGSTKAFYIQTAESGAAQLTETGNEGTEIPANTAVVLVNEDADASTLLNMTTGLAPVIDQDANLLKGTLIAMQLDLGDETYNYALGKKDNKIGFYKFEKDASTSITLGANKAYLNTSATASEARGFVFDYNDPTGIISIEQGTADNVNGTVYDLSGRRVDTLKHGIYIINGKKVIK